MYSTNLKNKIRTLGKIVLLTIMLSAMSSCKDDDTTITSPKAKPFDSSLPVSIQSFTPEKGSAYEQLIIYGSNFGNDKDAVKLKIGGKDATVINVASDKLYAFVPPMAFSGEIELTILDRDGKGYSASSPKNFIYDAQPVVGTLCGYQNDNDSQGELWGSFDICCGFNAEGCLAIDPLYPDRVYICYDKGAGMIAQLDLANRECTPLMSATKFQTQRLRNIDFTLDGQYMLVSTDREDHDYQSTSVWIVSRNADGTFSDRSSCQPLVAYKQCNGVAVHPVNGEVYFNSYSNGELFRMNPQDYFDSFIPDEDGNTKTWTGYKEDGAFKELFKIQDPSYEFQITIHPSGNYAYIVVINRSYILRTDYDWEKKEFTTPYVVAGSNGSEDWTDAVGTNARLHRPYQGVFVKNPQYEEEGKDDVYDFYFCDCLNFCVRYLTPEGIVRTYAGRAPSTNGNIWGTEDGSLRQAARFRDVTGIAYDKVRERFYVLDHNNRRIRTIGKEREDDIIVGGGNEDNSEENTEVTE